MARTKRKVNPIIPAPAVELETASAFHVAGYVRLSTEDSGKLGADVIEAQKEMVAHYIEQQPDMRLHKIYCDNGWTGTNFERPGFECLMNDVRSGKVNCIVVKDLSRFGRNYKEAGHYLEHIFPYLGVRFVAINDHFDTADQGIHDGYIVPLTNILNESYSRDISRKISSAIKTKELHGDFRGPFAPYGYSKCPADHGKLEINPETAPVVTEIFALRVQGMGYTGIARLLNKRGVPAPGAYLYQKGLSDRETYRDALWTAWNMKTILHSEVYLGHLIQGKRTQVSYKRKREERYAPADEWRVARNTHPPIIDEATFAAVQELARQSKASFEVMPGKGAADDLKTPNLFKKLIYCADCGKAMNRRHLYSRKAEGRVYYYSYQCVTSQKLPGACSPKNLMESELMAVVSNAIRQQMDTIAALEERVSKEYASASSEKRRTLDRQIAQVKQEQSRSQTLLDGLYQNLVDGMLTREEYLSMKGHYQKRFDDATLRLADLNAQLQQLERYGPSNPMFAVCRTLRNTEGLTEELIHLLVSRIEVHDGNRLDIKLVYQDEVEALLRFLREGGDKPVTIAIYVRLSLEDGTDQESASIVNQRHLLLDFIRNDPDLYGAKVVEFSDDGYSGKNFDRPGVQALLKAALCGEVQCILVKDISRFGRDYITVGNYITRVFPFKGVRFISVNDNFDSNRKGDIDSLDRAFRALIYDLYSRDISKKVKSAKLRLAQRGVNINPVAPYGYLKAPGDKHKLIPDTKTAPIVQRIFTLVADGTSTEKVAEILNAEGIPTPSKAKEGTPSAHANWRPNYWRRATIDWIIRDRQYIGSMVYGKRVRPRIGVHQQLTAKLENWIIVADCHEPLVTKELFAKAQERLGGEQRQLSTHNKWKNPLSKKVYCGVCGYAIVRRGTKNRYYCCQTPRTVPGMECHPEKVFESEILDVVTEAIRQQARCVVDAQRMMEQRRKSQEATVALLRKKVKKLEALQRELSQRIEKLYEDAVIDNLLSRDAYTAQKARLVEQRDEAHRAEAEIQAELFERTRDCSIYMERYRLYADMEVLPDDAIADLLDRVTVWPDGRLEVSLKFLNELPVSAVAERETKTTK